MAVVPLGKFTAELQQVWQGGLLQVHELYSAQAECMSKPAG